jgi:hypothetical protein
MKWMDKFIEPEPPEDCDDDDTWEKYNDDCNQAEMDFGKMRDTIARSIAWKCAEVTLITALRHKAGGQMNTLEPHYWNTERALKRDFIAARWRLIIHFQATTGHRTHIGFTSRETVLTVIWLI